MTELIVALTLILSALGIIAFVWRKIPVLVKIPEDSLEKTESLALKLKRKFKESNPFKGFSYEIFLQKLLTKVRILSLKTDNKTFHWIQNLREKAKKKRRGQDDDYWEEVKKIKKEGN